MWNEWEHCTDPPLKHRYGSTENKNLDFKKTGDQAGIQTTAVRFAASSANKRKDILKDYDIISRTWRGQIAIYMWGQCTERPHRGGEVFAIPLPVNCDQTEKRMNRTVCRRHTQKWKANTDHRRTMMALNGIWKPNMANQPPSTPVQGCFFLFFFPIPFIVFALLLSLPPSRNSDPGSHRRLFSPPPHCGSCLAFLSREKLSFPRRLASNCAYPR